MEWENGFNRELGISEEQSEQLHDERLEEIEFQIVQDERPPASDADEQPERKKLNRELQAEALTRLEDAARTPDDFKNITDWWDKLDANRERRERYHEVLRSGDDFPLEFGMKKDGMRFPMGSKCTLVRQIRKGDFLDAIYNCPYELHELVTDTDISDILRDLKEDQKELLFLWAVRLCSSAKIAAVRGQSERNIRKVRMTMLKQIHKKLLAVLQEKSRQGLPLTLEEKVFLTENEKTAFDGNKSSQYSSNTTTE